MFWVTMVSGLALGLAGSLHCVGMCGPLVLLLNRNEGNKYRVNFLYFLGKTFTYVTLGFIMGQIGLTFHWLKWQQSLSIVLGIALLIVVFFPIPLRNIPLYSWVLRMSAPILKSKKSNMHSLYFGVLNGLLPCGLVYAALSAALLQSDSLHAMIFMLFFGIGTSPILFSVKTIFSILQQKFKIKLKQIHNFTLLTLSLFFLLRGMNLGIPFLSPKIEGKQMNCCKQQD